VPSRTSNSALAGLPADRAVFVHDAASERRMQGEQFFSQDRAAPAFKT